MRTKKDIKTRLGEIEQTIKGSETDQFVLLRKEADTLAWVLEAEEEAVPFIDLPLNHPRNIRFMVVLTIFGAVLIEVGVALAVARWLFVETDWPFYLALAAGFGFMWISINVVWNLAKTPSRKKRWSDDIISLPTVLLTVFVEFVRKIAKGLSDLVVCGIYRPMKRLQQQRIEKQALATGSEPETLEPTEKKKEANDE